MEAEVLNPLIDWDKNKTYESPSGDIVAMYRYDRWELFHKQPVYALPPYLIVKEKGLSWYHFLNIHGGSGKYLGMMDRGYGGEYNFCVAYVEPDELAKKGDKCIRSFCVEKGIPFGVGDTIMEAYGQLVEKLKTQPLKNI